jgi:hypothetical protein
LTPALILYRHAETLWERGATTSEMARMLNVPYGRAEQLRKRISIRREEEATRDERKRRIEQRTIAAECGARSVVGPAEHVSLAGRYSGSLEPPVEHHYDPRLACGRIGG